MWQEEFRKTSTDKQDQSEELSKNALVCVSHAYDVA